METNESSEHHDDRAWRDVVLENALDAVIGIDDNSKILDWNKQAEVVFGWMKDEAIGKSVTIIIPHSFHKAHYEGIKHYLRTGDGPILNRRIELSALHKDGNEFPIELTVIPLIQGKNRYFFSFIRDITERKKLVEDLQNAIKARDQFMSICSHELKTPITSMSLVFQLAEKRMASEGKVYEPEEVRKRISVANRQIEKMSRLVEDMLDVGRIATGNMSFEFNHFNIEELFQEVLLKFKEILEFKKIKVHCEVIPGNMFVKADRIRIEQVMSNFITNAIKYGKGNPIHFKLMAQGQKVVFSLKDQGIGISKTNLEKIFHRFERLVSSSEVSGLGLGLFISEEIIKAHGGKIFAESDSGKGSTFTFELPNIRLSPSPSSSQTQVH